MDHDPADDGQPERRLPYVVLQERVAHLGERLRGKARGALEPRVPATAFVPSTETVQLDVRRHPLVLMWPALRTVTGLLVVVAGPQLLLALLLAGATAVSLGARVRPGPRTTAVASLAVVTAAAFLSTWLVVLGLLLWVAHDVADWLHDRLVVTDRRIYRRYGVVTSHAPSIALTAIAFLDASVPPLGRVFGYGTLRLDSVAQRDAPLSRFDNVPAVTGVSHEILALRAKAMPKYPPPVV